MLYGGIISAWSWITICTPSVWNYKVHFLSLGQAFGQQYLCQYMIFVIQSWCYYIRIEKNTYNYDFVSHIGRDCRSRSCPNEANELFLVISNGGIRLQSPITQNQYWLVHELDIRHSSMLNIFSLIIDLGKEKWSEVIFFCDHDHI